MSNTEKQSAEMIPERPTPPDAASQVAQLPRRVAHVTYALITAATEHCGGAVASEVVIYDSESYSTSQTSSALRRAKDYGLAINSGKVWVPTPHAQDLAAALEQRFLDETEEGI